MKLGIMQPYFLPYLGYWQLMNAVDTYIVYDDVNYIKRGRINRNNILINGESKTINLILKEASQNKHINEIFIDNNEVQKRKLLSKIQMAYSKAPYFSVVFPMIEQIFLQHEENLAKYLYNSFQIIAGYLNIQTKIILSSSLNKDCSLKGKYKIVSICKLLGADEYYNSVGGMELYDKDEFADMDTAFEKVGKVFGLAAVCRAAVCEKSFEAICNTAEEYMGQQLRTDR